MSWYNCDWGWCDSQQEVAWVKNFQAHLTEAKWSFLFPAAAASVKTRIEEWTSSLISREDELVLQLSDVRDLTLQDDETLRRIGQSDSCLLALFVCHLNMTYAVVLIYSFCTAIVLSFSAASHSVATILVCVRSLSEQGMGSSQAVILNKWSTSNVKRMMSPNIPVCSATAVTLKDSVG